MENVLDIQGFVVTDWAGSLFDRRSTSRYYITFGSNLVVWKSKNQSGVAWSSTEAEYRAVTKATTELLWMKLLLGELGFSIPGAIKLWCDNKAPMQLQITLCFMKELNILN